MIFKKKSGFSLAEILVTLGLVGAVAALTIPTLAYNYKSKVLEEQFRSTYNEVRQIGAMINSEKDDVGIYANKLSYQNWEKEFVSRLNGGNNLLNTPGHANIHNELRRIYREAGTDGPFYFNLSAAGKKQSSSIICDNGSIWLDSKGRLWTFNAESRIVCVDINGIGNPNRLNIDIFAFIPMTAEQSAVWVYDDPENPNNYSGTIVLCDIDRITRKGLSNTYPTRDEETGAYVKGTRENPLSALDACPFYEPIENIAMVNGFSAAKSARNRTVTKSDNYWKSYIDYK